MTGISTRALVRLWVERPWRLSPTVTLDSTHATAVELHYSNGRAFGVLVPNARTQHYALDTALKITRKLAGADVSIHTFAYQETDCRASMPMIVTEGVTDNPDTLGMANLFPSLSRKPRPVSKLRGFGKPFNRKLARALSAHEWPITSHKL